MYKVHFKSGNTMLITQEVFDMVTANLQQKAEWSIFKKDAKESIMLIHLKDVDFIHPE